MKDSTQQVRSCARVTFVTGTDTGVGKTILTGLIVLYLRRCGVNALAMKPFCTGDRHDAGFLSALQNAELSIEEINPVYFPEPLAPLAAAQARHRTVSIRRVLKLIYTARDKCDWLVIEGVGGVLVPLTNKRTVADLISELQCETVVVARNRLGTINHTLLTVEALRRRGVKSIRIVLMDQDQPDPSSASNQLIIRKLVQDVPIYRIGFLGSNANDPSRLKEYFPKVKKIVAQLLQ